MLSAVRAGILAGAAFASAAACGSRAETAGESPLVVADNGTMITVEGPQITTTLPDTIAPVNTTTSVDVPTTQKQQSTTTTETLPPKQSTPPTSEYSENVPDTLITEDGIGDIYIGQSMADIEQHYALFPGCSDQTFSVEGPQLNVTVDFEGGLVDQIQIYDIGPMTKEGIGVGSTDSEVMSAYSKIGRTPTTSMLEGLHGNLSFFVAEGPNADLRFHMDGWDGAFRVNNIYVTRPGVDVSFACE